MRDFAGPGGPPAGRDIYEAAIIMRNFFSLEISKVGDWKIFALEFSFKTARRQDEPSRVGCKPIVKGP